MYMRIVWGKILEGKWEEYEAAFKKAMSVRGEVKGLKSHWLVRDQADKDAGYSISLWETEKDMDAYWDSDKRQEAMSPVHKYYVNQFTVTNCEVRYSS